MSNMKHLFKQMVILTLLLTFPLLEIHAQITVKMKDKPASEVVKQIEKVSKYRFFYKKGLPGMNTPITVETNDQSIEVVLGQIVQQIPVAYAIKGETQVVLTEPELQNTNTNLTKFVKGTVTDANGEPIIGANIMEKGTINGTITDMDGNFSLTVKEGAILVVSYVGYITQDLPVKNRATLVIHLKENSQALGEVVVTALGIKREEKALGYSVQKMSGDDMPMAKSVDITTSLTGKIAGLNIQNNTEFDQDATISLRGSTPLLIVDGIPYANLSINEIAADDIESVDVLKGATASALYGARGSSGAIMITTKKGSDKEGLNININSNTMFFSGYLAFPETQHSYSAGTGGKYNNNSVWGDKLDIGRTAVQWDPKTYEYREMELTSKGKDNFKNFLQFSMVTNNNVSVTQKGKYGSFRASATQVYNKGEYPNQKLNNVYRQTQ